ncbi:hypothetical protein CLIB1444_16S00408 [[Candida] jaroonii]|uniref:Uncharacterized protein n=1 Tax=[Candida] jaroonii TaxID=467808 RepID=A0ACA9YEJ7_9ASCO|nr:hypothetical protein CLIB1444_16S00408 [[Candida] jaroonii]
MVAISKYSSPTVQHVKSYPVVSSFTSYLLTFQIFDYLNTQISTLLNSGIDFISKYPVVIDNVKLVDGKFNSLVLNTFDSIISVPISYYNVGKTKYETTFDTFNKYYFDTINYYLGISNEYKFDGSKVYQFFKISNYGLLSSKDIVIANGKKFSDYSISTINKEIETLPKEIKSYPKIAYNVLVKFYNDFNENYYTPIKNQTTDYVQDVANQTKSKADLYVKNLNFIPKEKVEIEIPVVSASA